MSKWYDDADVGNKFFSCKEGEKKIIKVKEIKKIVGDIYSKYNYKRKTGDPLLTKDGQPFHHVLIDNDDKTLTIGSISLLSALSKTEVDNGDIIELYHAGRGDYRVKKLKEAKVKEDVLSEEPEF